ncbi:MAG: hypothetical protein IJN29_04305, partial [Akkermansia sp.]|nr:hypothetical protein [Akkermansia sp.]
MKTRLPKTLLVALIATFVSNAVAETITGNHVEQVTTGHRAVVIKEGSLNIGDGTTETIYRVEGTYGVDGKAQFAQEVFVVAGSSSVVIDNAVFKSVPADTQVGVGDASYAEGDSSMLVTNGSLVDTSAATTLYLGYKSNAVLTIEKQSKFIGGYNNFWMYGGSINVADIGSELRLCAAGSGYNYRAIMGLTGGGSTTINVTNGASVICSATQFITNFSDGSSTNINVDGAGSSLTHTATTYTEGYYPVGQSGEWHYMEAIYDSDGDVNRAAGWYDVDSTRGEWINEGKGQTITYIGDMGTDKSGCWYGSVNNTETNISATNGGVINFDSGLTYIGSFRDRTEGATNKFVNFTIGKGSSISFNRVEMYADTTITNEGNFIVKDSLTLHSGLTLTLNLTKANQSTPVITLGAGDDATWSRATVGGKVKAEDDVTLVINGTENMAAGTKFILVNDASLAEGIDKVTVLGTEADITSDGTNTIITLLEEVYLGHDPLADAVQAANWGVYKSSQAFSSLLWAPRSNAVVVKNIEKPTADGKGSIMTTEVEGRTLAWGSVYSSFSRNSSSGAFAGAEYSIVGGAIGVERQFACGSSIGAAFGYDWGKASPFTT